MKNFISPKVLSFSLLIVMFMFFYSVVAQTAITIEVAPNVLNLSNNAQVVTVHTDLAYSAVQASTVYLNDIEISSWKADDRGNFVAKFRMLAVKNLPLYIGEYNTLTLTGKTTSGASFSGSTEIKVINVLPQR